jgi:catechol 2,3-dioxygenase-like lactoylglutathione lyase family enzyme
MPLNHVTVMVADVERSLRFYRDGLGFAVKIDREFEGDWEGLFGVASDRIRAVILGDDDRAQQIELLTFANPVPVGPAPNGPVTGTAVVALHVDLATVLPALRENGATQVRETKLRNGTPIATVRDPDGVLVELIDIAGAPKVAT